MIKILKNLEGKGAKSVYNFFKVYSMDSVCETVLGVKVCAQNESNHPFPKAFEENCEIFLKKGLKPYIYSTPFYKLTSSYRTFVENNEIIRDFVKKIIKSKREEHENKKETDITDIDEGINNHKPQTFLDTMIKTPGNENLFSDEELLEESIVLLIGATDTSATAAALIAMMLSRYPDVQDKVYNELQKVFNDSDRPVTAKDLTQLHYLEAVIKETLRLYPPGPVTIRKVDKDVTIPSGLTLVKGSSFLFHMWAINRNPQYWGQDADEFKPERFIDGAPVHPAAFSTFSFGPRNCIGYKYAFLSMKTVIANLLRNFELLPAEASDIYTINGKCLEKEKPLRLKFEVMVRDVSDFSVRLESRVKGHQSLYLMFSFMFFEYLNLIKLMIYLGKRAYNNGGLCALWFGTKFITVVADPVTLDYLSKTCLEKDEITNVVQPLIGNGSIFAPVSIWRPRRKIVASHFSLAKLNSFVDIFSQQSQVMVKILKRLEGKGTISVHDYFKMYFMDSVCETILGVKLDTQNKSDHSLLTAFEENCLIFIKKTLEPYIYDTPFYKLTSSYRTFTRNNAIVRDFIKEVIKSKREEYKNEKENITDFDENIENDEPQAFLDMMIKSSGKGHGLTDEELLEESIVLLVAGTDTSATGVALVAMMLSRHPDVQNKVYKE
ncbi:hypothetical protein O3G_MSEX014974 [Manduca sexta]|uniref:Cytochrome P450 n=1 Tax=Manduca sexta TaxID=7130 RepID=A0A922D3D4_MANSE|nr:hypothetical protein O3G_MSEX014974 [Manduca sexta]